MRGNKKVMASLDRMTRMQGEKSWALHPIARFRRTGLHKVVSQSPLVRVPINLGERFGIDNETRWQREQALAEAELLVRLEPRTPIIIHYDLSVESTNLGEIVATLFLAKYLARANFPVNFVLTNFAFTPNSGFSGAYDWHNRQLELKTLAKQMSDGLFRLTIRDRKGEDDSKMGFSGHTVFRSHNLTRTPIVHGAMALFGVRKFVEKFGDPKTLVDWKPSGFVGWHIRSSPLNSARNYHNVKLLVRDARALTTSFPGVEIRVFTDSNGRREVSEAATQQSFLEKMLSQGTITFQRASDFPGAAIEAASSDFWFQRLGGGINLVPLFSEMPFLILSEDFRVSNLVASHKSKFYFWHNNSQTWLRSANAAFRRLPRGYLAIHS